MKRTFLAAVAALLLAVSAFAQVPIYTKGPSSSTSSVLPGAFPLLAPDGTKTAPSYSWSSEASGFYRRTTNTYGFAQASKETLTLLNSGTFEGIAATGSFMLGAAGSDLSTTAPDTFLTRDAANVLALRNGTNPQLFRVYNTFTDATHNEFGYFFWATNQFQIGTLNNNATNRDIVIVPGGTVYATFSVASSNVQLSKPLLVSTAATANQVRTAQTTPPTCTTNCGTSPSVAGTDTAMIVTLGTTPASAFLITFNGTWAAAPSCVGAANTAGTTKAVTSITTTTTTATVATAAAPATGDKYNLICMGVS